MAQLKFSATYSDEEKKIEYADIQYMVDLNHSVSRSDVLRHMYTFLKGLGYHIADLDAEIDQ